jgi:hypothetical protein
VKLKFLNYISFLWISLNVQILFACHRWFNDARFFLSQFICRTLMLCLCYLCLLAYIGAQYLVLLYVFTFLVPCCDVRYHFRIKTMFQLFVWGLMSNLCYLCFLPYNGVKHVLTIWLKPWVSYKRQEFLIFESTWVHLQFLVGSVILIFFLIIFSGEYCFEYTPSLELSQTRWR